MKCRKKLILSVILIMLILPNTVAYASPLEAVGDWISEKVTKFLVNITDEMFYYLAKAGISIDAMVYNTDTVMVPEVYTEDHPAVKYASYTDNAEYGEVENKLKFSFDEDNYYGQVSRPIYTIVKSIAMMAMFCLTYVMGLKLMKGKSASSKLSAKSAISDYLFSMLLIVCMPEILSIANMIVSMITKSLNVSGGSLGLGFVEQFREAALESGNPFNGAIYFGSVALTLWFAVVYLYRNLMMIFLFMFFPIFGLFINGEKTKRVIDGWTWEVMSYLIVPIIDALLLLAVTGLISYGLTGLMALLATACIIPIRGKFRNMIGLGAGKSEMAGFMAVAGVAGLATKGIRGLKDGIGGVVSGAGDVRAANMFGRSNETANNSNNVETSESSVSTVTGINSNRGTNYGMLQGRKLEMPAKVPKNSEESFEAYNLRRQGYSKIAKSTIGMTGGLIGGAMGGAALSLMGTGPMAYGAQVGGALGSLVGEGAGSLGGLGFHDMFYDQIRSKNERANLKSVNAQPTSASSGLPVNAQANTQPTPFESETIKVDVDNLERVTMDVAPINTNASTTMHSDTGALPKGYDTDTFAKDVNSMISKEIDKEIRDKAFTSTMAATGINPVELEQQHNTIAGKYYGDKVNEYEKNGTVITPEIQVNLTKEANNYANEALDINKKLELFKQVGQAEYERQTVGVLYDQLKDSGYSPSMLDNYQDWIKNDIADMIRNDMNSNMRNDFSVSSVDDII